MGERTCSVDGCERKFYGRGLCSMHCRRLSKTGTTDARVFQPRVCLVDDCDGNASAPGTGRGWCRTHYYRWKKHGDPLGAHVPVVGIAECAIDGCGKLVKARGWCVKHWTRWHRFGDPEARLLGEVVDGRRICPTCQKDKLLAAWTKGECKRCARERARTRRTDPAVKEVERAYYKRIAAANPDLMARRAREWRSRNPEQVRAATARRRAMRVNATVEHFTPHEIFERDGWICGICGNAIPKDAVYPDAMSVSLDHILPLSLGGSHERANTQAAHLICNVRKGARAG